MNVSQASSVQTTPTESSIFFWNPSNKLLIVTGLFAACLGIAYVLRDDLFSRQPRRDVRGTFNGRGVRVLSLGTRLEGYFIDGKLHGQGQIILPNTMTITGTFDHGQAKGRMKIIDPDGEPWEGEIHNVSLFLED